VAAAGLQKKRGMVPYFPGVFFSGLVLDQWLVIVDY